MRWFDAIAKAELRLRQIRARRAELSESERELLELAEFFLGIYRRLTR